VRPRTRILIVTTYLLLIAAGIAYSQTFVERYNDISGVISLGIAILCAAFGFGGAWFGLGYKINTNKDNIKELKTDFGKHCEHHEIHDDQIQTTLAEILRRLPRP